MSIELLNRNAAVVFFQTRGERGVHRRGLRAQEVKQPTERKFSLADSRSRALEFSLSWKCQVLYPMLCTITYINCRSKDWHRLLHSAAESSTTRRFSGPGCASLHN